MAKKGTSAAAKARFLAYRTNNTSAKNALKRLSKHLKCHPNDKQSAAHTVPNYTSKKGSKK